jgi:cell division GTPase FtsZ
MKILLLSAGGGGGNIVRSVKAMFQRDLLVTRQADATYAERLRSAVTTCCLDTNEFSLADLPADEKLLIGARTTGRLGARHNPEVAAQALDESKSEVEALMSRHSVIVLIGTGGKGTGAGTMFPLAQMAREQKKLVIPIFVRPSFERHEVDKRRYDHALKVSQQFDAAKMRLVEILNDRGYTDSDPKPQTAVWERMNAPIARGLRGLIYVLWDLSQVDPSDLSTLFAGHGRLRIGFGEIDPPAGQDPGDEQVEQAVRDCWQNPYCSFSRPAGTTLICIQGDWSNVVDAKIKSGLATLAISRMADSPYNPLSARALKSPRPWGVTALFAEATGDHPPLEIDWRFATSATREIVGAIAIDPVPLTELPPQPVQVLRPAPGAGLAEPAPRPKAQPGPSFSNFWEFAVAVNRSDPAALALASNGAKTAIPVDGLEIRKLLGTMWFREVVPRLSEEWRTRLLSALVDAVEIPNHVVKVGGRTTHLSECTYSELQELKTRSAPEITRSDLELLLTIARLWGGDALGRLHFTGNPRVHEASRFGRLLQGLRG